MGNLEALAFVALSMLVLVANSALSFQATGLVSSTGRSGVVMQEKSKAIPFLNAAPALDGTMPGDKGFDPLLLSNTVPLRWAREAELKHARVCMLGLLVVLAGFEIVTGIPKCLQLMNDPDARAPGDYRFDPRHDGLLGHPHA